MPLNQITTIQEVDERKSESTAVGTRDRAEVLQGHRVWIDLDNSPHVPFFLPIIGELEQRGCELVLSARDCFQVCELANLAGLRYRTIGRHYGKNRIAKLVGLGVRVIELLPFVFRSRPTIAISHGSRSLIVLSAIMRIPCITIADYEHADLRLTQWLGSKRQKWIMTPEVISPDIFVKQNMLRSNVLQYPGIKEDVYVPGFTPDPGINAQLGLGDGYTVVTVRPPAGEAHYHNSKSDELFAAVLDRLAHDESVKVILLPRNVRQEKDIRRVWSKQFERNQFLIPPKAVDGLSLIWTSDLVVSGGGTMNREAAALGVPVYSVFRGKIGAVDRYLSETNRLVMLETVEEVRTKIRVERRQRNAQRRLAQQPALSKIVEHIVSVLERTCN